MFFLIKEVLEEVNKSALNSATEQYVAILTTKEWETDKETFDMGIEIEPDSSEIFSTMAEVNYDSLTGTFSIPDRSNLSNDSTFAFALDEKGIVFIDDSGESEKYIRNIQKTRHWKLPSLERFIYDFLDQIIKDDLRLMEKYERELDSMEQAILSEEENLNSGRVNDIRGDIRDLLIHYEQLADMAQEFEENENCFFKTDNLRYFRLYLNRIARLRDRSVSLRDYTMQIRDLYKAHLDIKQNRIMTILTVVTTIFMPLTLIVGWYGMNFKYMPELEYRYSYPIVFGVSIVIVVCSLLFFKKKKWL
ncbi:magnesium transporter CorA family protein [Butyrivibrio sp. WCE2006]|uniref:magnesium transporter CorA family protein n=1 Tax=Butyrivibrio sp. WCE2006 TaxID=1410611 RepID=UPI0005D1AE96|nr:CorA family divalent cation transporter [Butyrivibrio sp. WCE2006]